MAFLTFLSVASSLGFAIRALANTRRLEADLYDVKSRLSRLELGSAATQCVQAQPTPQFVKQETLDSTAYISANPTPEMANGIKAIFDPDWEKLLVENWLIWLGGIALALGGAFLVKLSIDHGLLTPFVRVGMGTALGMILVSLAEWVNRRDSTATASYIPQALAAAGLATLFASILAAYQLYGLLSATPAFLLLAGIAALAMALSLRYGPYVAALGLLGAYVVPALIQNTTPQSPSLFSYLSIVTTASIALLRYKSWNWLGWLTLVGGFSWVTIWLVGPFTANDTSVIGLYLSVLLMTFSILTEGIAFAGVAIALVETAFINMLTRTAFWAASISTIALVVAAGFSTASLFWLLAVAIGTLRTAFRGEHDDLLVASALPLLVVLAAWMLPIARPSLDYFTLLIPAQDLLVFKGTSAIGAMLFGICGFVGLSRVERPGGWAALSVITPLVILGIDYWRLDALDPSIAWSGMGILLATVYLIAAERLIHRKSAKYDAALAAFAIGALSGTCLAAAMVLREAWLTVALVLHLPILGWVNHHLRLKALRTVALGIAGFVLVRLVLNPEIVHYSLNDSAVFNWLLYGYGVPAAAFIIATRFFRRDDDDQLVKFLEAGSIVFVTALVTFDLRLWLGHASLEFRLSNLLTDSAETVVWLVMAAALLCSGRLRQREVVRWSGIILYGVATAQAVLWQALYANPLITENSIGTGLIFNSLLIAYGLPAGLYAVIAYLRLGPQPLLLAARGLALGFSLLYVTLEIRHSFRGEILTAGLGGQAEWYAYSVAWLVYSVVLLGLGVYFGSVWLRKIAFAALGLVVLKVFLSDAADLNGVWRALSFIGLGAMLIAVGFAYRQLVPPSDPLQK